MRPTMDQLKAATTVATPTTPRGNILPVRSCHRHSWRKGSFIITHEEGGTSVACVDCFRRAITTARDVTVL